MTPSTDHPALRTALITYIGNKRSLLPLINEGIDACLGRMRGHTAGRPGAAGETDGRPLRFADPFTGSGVVSRLARLRGFTAHANDLEVYSRPFGTAFLRTSPDEIEELFSPIPPLLRTRGLTEPAPTSLFSSASAYTASLEMINTLKEPSSPTKRYFALHYAPKSTDSPDPERERLFYTRENALKIDAVLEVIHDTAPSHREAADILLASLLVAMSVHNNTSGVMKGFHHGWGGRGGDALSRILAPITVNPLPFISGPVGTVTIGDATTVFGSSDAGEFDICYVDPPYNIHQYGANYHLLTTATLNDRYDPGPVIRGSRAGIRTDHNRSPYCRRSRATPPATFPASAKPTSAAVAFHSFLESIRCRFLLVSYNNDGIIPAEDLISLLSDNGAAHIDFLTEDHHKFRGGKNTQSSLTTNEYLFIVDRCTSQSAGDVERIRATVEATTHRRSLTDQYIDPLQWAAEEKSGSEDRRSTRTSDGWILSSGTREVAYLDRRMRVQKLNLTLKTDGAHIEAATIPKTELFDRYLRTQSYEEALYLLRTFKIRKHHHLFRIVGKVIRERNRNSVMEGGISRKSSADRISRAHNVIGARDLSGQMH